MLSYRHSYHAGNFADVLKHITQVLIIEALQQKQKPFVYYDTHAGAGRYDLKSKSGQKIAEYKLGIRKLMQQQDMPPLLRRYSDIVKSINTDGKLKFYPGSPLVANLLMDRKSRLELSELHPSDFNLLQQEFENSRNCKVTKIDGFKNLLAKLPPIQRRGLILIDPPYELKTEYNDVVKGVKQAYKQFATGVYAIWYPVVSRHNIESFCKRFKNSGIKNILRIEMCMGEDKEEHGMTGTGLIVVNPPWKLKSQMQETLPWLTKVLKQDEYARFKVEQLVSE